MIEMFRPMSSSTSKLISILNDGYFHSGEDLASQLGLSRASIWKQISVLRDKGVDIHAVHGRGYRLSVALETLEEQTIISHIEPDIVEHIRLDIHDELESTNQWLMQLPKTEIQAGRVCLAEYQTAGRGRRGRTWVSPYGANIYMSVLWRVQMPTSEIASLSLVCGVVLARVLTKMGAVGVGLKWPNDVVSDGKKLAGILLEMSGEADGDLRLVIGVGVNVSMPIQEARNIEQPWIDLEAISTAPISRNVLVSELLNQLIPALKVFERGGFKAFAAEWNTFDAYIGREVELIQATHTEQGKVCGLNEQGVLLVEMGDGEIKAYQSGEISMRGHVR